MVVFVRQPSYIPRERTAMSAMSLEDFSARYGQPTGRTPRRGRKSAKPPYQPTALQLSTAEKRICCALERRNCVVFVESFDDAVAFCIKNVFNRGGGLGQYGDEFKAVITDALTELMNRKVVDLDIDLGVLRLARKPQKKKRSYEKRRAAYVA